VPDAYVSEASYAGTPSTDFVEVAVSAGTDVSGCSVQLYTQMGNWIVTMPFPVLSTSVAGKDVYLFETNLSGGTAVVIVDDTGTAMQFVSFYDPLVTSIDGDLAGQTPSYPGVTATSGDSIQSDDGGLSYYVQSARTQAAFPVSGRG